MNRVRAWRVLCALTGSDSRGKHVLTVEAHLRATPEMAGELGLAG